MRALLLFNPEAGKHRKQRIATMRAMTDVLNARGFEAVSEATLGRGTAGEQALAATRRGYEAIIACGGDGTIHEVLQGLVGTGATLGLLPLGSANALARELGLPANPVKAAARLSPFTTRAVQVGAVSTAECPRRYFLSMAGAGPDGQLMYRMLTVNRARFGRWLYYVHALHLFLKGPWRHMHVRWRDDRGTEQSVTAAATMALRIGDMGGVFRGIGRGASIDDPYLHTLLVRPPALVNFPLWFVSSWFRLTDIHPGIITTRTRELFLSGSSRLHVQADGEWLGTLPARISLGKEVIRVLVPTDR